MKTITVLIVLLSVLFTGLSYSQGAVEITFPEKGSIVNNRLNMKVTYSIPGFSESGAHYWIATASVQDAKKYFAVDIQERINRPELLEALSKWKLHEFWVKSYLKEGSGTITINDGGVNNRRQLQSMAIVILKVDDSISTFFEDWLDEGDKEKNWKGIPFSKLQPHMVVARCEIFFP